MQRPVSGRAHLLLKGRVRHCARSARIRIACALRRIERRAAFTAHGLTLQGGALLDSISRPALLTGDDTHFPLSSLPFVRAFELSKVSSRKFFDSPRRGRQSDRSENKRALEWSIPAIRTFISSPLGFSFLPPAFYHVLERKSGQEGRDDG